MRSASMTATSALAPSLPQPLGKAFMGGMGGIVLGAVLLFVVRSLWAGVTPCALALMDFGLLDLVITVLCVAFVLACSACEDVLWNAWHSPCQHGARLE